MTIEERLEDLIADEQRHAIACDDRARTFRQVECQNIERMMASHHRHYVALLLRLLAPSTRVTFGGEG